MLQNERNDEASKNSFDDKKERYHNKRFATGVFERLLASARRLLALVTKSEGVMTNKDMAKFADQINSLCDKWEI